MWLRNITSLTVWIRNIISLTCGGVCDGVGSAVEEEEECAQVATGASGAGASSAVELLDRFYAALPEAMGNTMCAEGDSLAAAARVGRARGLLGLFAQATAGVLSLIHI